MRQKVWINGWEWWVDPVSRETFKTEQSEIGISFKFLTKNEMEQVENQLRFGNWRDN
jgi:hypothetical protein